MPINPRALVMLSALSLGFACAPGEGGDKMASAIATVSREVQASNPAGVSSSDLAATPIPRGEGVVVYVKNRREQGLAWVVLDGQAYAGTSQAKRLTPALPYTSEARWDTWKQTGLDPANAASFFNIIDKAEAPGEAR